MQIRNRRARRPAHFRATLPTGPAHDRQPPEPWRPPMERATVPTQSGDKRKIWRPPPEPRCTRVASLLPGERFEFAPVAQGDGFQPQHLRAGFSLVAGHGDLIAGFDDFAVPAGPVQSERVRSLAIPFFDVALLVFCFDVNLHVRIDVLKIRDRALYGDQFGGVVAGGSVMRKGRNDKQQQSEKRNEQTCGFLLHGGLPCRRTQRGWAGLRRYYPASVARVEPQESRRGDANLVTRLRATVQYRVSWELKVPVG